MYTCRRKQNKQNLPQRARAKEGNMREFGDARAVADGVCGSRSATRIFGAMVRAARWLEESVERRSVLLLLALAARNPAADRRAVEGLAEKVAAAAEDDDLFEDFVRDINNVQKKRSSVERPGLSILESLPITVSRVKAEDDPLHSDFEEEKFDANTNGEDEEDFVDDLDGGDFDSDDSEEDGESEDGGEDDEDDEDFEPPGAAVKPRKAPYRLSIRKSGVSGAQAEKEDDDEDAPLKRKRGGPPKRNYYKKRTVLKTQLTPAPHKKYNCSRCPSYFVTSIERDHHEIVKHIRRRPTPPPGAGVPRDDDGSFVCMHCGKALKNRTCLRTHEKTMHKYTFHCDVCQEEFGSKLEVTRHQKRVHKVMKPCKTCGIEFEYTHLLKKHMKKEHPERYQQLNQCMCSLCGAVFPDKRALKFHDQRLHQEKNPELACDKCGKQFATKQLLGLHMRQNHLGIPCDLCGKQFTNRLALKTHTDNVHRESQEPLPCQFCGKTFSKPRSVKEHILKEHRAEKDRLKLERQEQQQQEQQQQQQAPVLVGSSEQVFTSI